MNSLRSRNDNSSGSKELTSDRLNGVAGINVYGGTVNIENLELSIVLPDSKKNYEKCTLRQVNITQDHERSQKNSPYRAIVLLILKLFFAGDSQVKKILGMFNFLVFAAPQASLEHT